MRFMCNSCINSECMKDKKIVKAQLKRKGLSNKKRVKRA